MKPYKIFAMLNPKIRVKEKPKDIYNTSYPYPFIKELPKLNRVTEKEMPRFGNGFVKATNFIDFDTT